MYKKWLYTILIIIPCYLSANTLVITRGPSCVGKSSACEAMDGLYAKWHVVCEDDIYIEQMIRSLDHLFPEYMPSIRANIAEHNLYHAIQRNQIIIDDNTLRQDHTSAYTALQFIRHFLDNPLHTQRRQGIAMRIKHTMLEIVYWHAAQGHDVLLDQTTCNDHDIKQFKECFNTVIIVGLYCQPSTLFTRFTRRNTGADNARNLHNKRVF